MSQDQTVTRPDTTTVASISRYINETLINAEIRAIRFGRPTKAVKSTTIDRRVQQHQATSLSGTTND